MSLVSRNFVKGTLMAPPCEFTLNTRVRTHAYQAFSTSAPLTLFSRSFSVVRASVHCIMFTACLAFYLLHVKVNTSSVMTTRKVSGQMCQMCPGSNTAPGSEPLVWIHQTQVVAFLMNLSKSQGRMDFVILALSIQESKGTVGPQVKQSSLGSF